MPGLPEGTVTFLLTDLVGSTHAWERDPATMRRVLRQHDTIVASAVAENRGVIVETGREGDSVLAAFRNAIDAAACALRLQRAVAAGPWPNEQVKMRIALHTGQAELRDGHYYGQPLNRCARLLATCHGGQILATSATQQMLQDELPPQAALWDLGKHQLKDLTRPERVYQLVDSEQPTRFPPIRSLPGRSSNLPTQLTSFVGRHAELRQLIRLQRRSRLLTVTGPGGSGKTRLALVLASSVASDFPDGVWLTELAPLTDPGLVARAVASSLGISDEQSGRHLLDLLVQHLAERVCLLILDNCEHVVAACAELVEALLQRCPELSLVVTSREALKVPGEVIWRTPPLAPADAVRLFGDRAGSLEPTFRLNDSNRSAVRRLCQELDGIPLAIELAAARAPGMTVAEILERLGSRFSLLTDGNRTTAVRQRTLQAAIDWSHDLLTGTEKQLFRRVSIFAGRFTLAAAEDVCASDSLPAAEVSLFMSQLVSKSLVVREVGHYRFLATIRAYGRERLGEAGELDLLQAGMARYLLQLAETRQPGRLAEWLDRIEEHHDDLRATLNWCLSTEVELGVRLAGATYHFWVYRGHAAEPRQFVEAALERAPAEFRERAFALYLAGGFAYVAADFQAAAARLDEALRVARSARDRLTEIRILETSGMLATVRGDLAGAEATLQEGLRLSDQMGDEVVKPMLLHQLGLVAAARGDAPAARSFLEKSVAVRLRLGRDDENNLSLSFLGALAMAGGDFETAGRCLRESLEIGLALGDRRAAWSLDVLAALSAVKGDAERALRLAGAGSAMRQASGNAPPEAWDRFVTPLLEPARLSLGPDAAASAWESGRRLDYQTALAYALEEEEGVHLQST